MSKMSLPVWERGLKGRAAVYGHVAAAVAPRVGAWIESQKLSGAMGQASRRSPCGSVD